MNEDTAAVQAAIGEKVGALCKLKSGQSCPFQYRVSNSGPHAGNFVHNITTFVVGYAIAFARSWQLSLVMLSVVPALAVAGLVFGTLAGKLSTKAADAYGVANSSVQQVL